MKHFSKKIVFAFVIGALLALAVPMTAGAAEAEQNGCVIPESGPWPPCATGGNSAPAPSGNACPDSGVWPPGCIPGGSGAPAPAPSGNACPTSGVWPPGCIPGGSGGGDSAPAPAPAGNACPTSGPWPPGCIPGGSGGGTPAPAPAPAPEAEPAPAPAPEAEPAPAEEGEILGFRTIVYRSDPDEVIAVVPVMIFDANLMLQRLEFMSDTFNSMLNDIESAAGGDEAACARYIASYDALRESGIWFVEIPTEWGELDFRYYEAWIATLDRTRPSYLSCLDSGKIDNFNKGLAVQILIAARDYNNATLDATRGRLGR